MYIGRKLLKMHVLPVAKIIRIKGAHFPELLPGIEERELLYLIKSKGFVLEQAYDNDFYEIYSHPEYKDSNKNMIVHLDNQGIVHFIASSVIHPDPIAGF